MRRSLSAAIFASALGRDPMRFRTLSRTGARDWRISSGGLHSARVLFVRTDAASTRSTGASDVEISRSIHSALGRRSFRVQRVAGGGSGASGVSAQDAKLMRTREAGRASFIVY